MVPSYVLALPVAQQQLVLRHELTHVARGDAWGLLVWQLLVALCWFNPLLGRWQRGWQQAVELQVDRAVCAAPADESVQSIGLVVWPNFVAMPAPAATASTCAGDGLDLGHDSLSAAVDGIVSTHIATWARATSPCVGPVVAQQHAVGARLQPTAPTPQCY